MRQLQLVFEVPAPGDIDMCARNAACPAGRIAFQNFAAALDPDPAPGFMAHPVFDFKVLVGRAGRPLNGVLIQKLQVVGMDQAGPLVARQLQIAWLVADHCPPLAVGVDYASVGLPFPNANSGSVNCCFGEGA